VPIITPLLSNPAYPPLPANIAYTKAAFSELLDYPLQFRHCSPADIRGSAAEPSLPEHRQNQTPGLIDMKHVCEWGNYESQHIVVIFNAPMRRDFY